MDTLERWHAYVEGNDPQALDALIAEECVFHSPAVHTPQAGKAITIKYLTAALAVLKQPDFRYVGEWRADRSAVLEFQLSIDGIQIDGVDIITWGADGRIIAFKVMMRPLKALNTILPLMGARLGAA
ncbi:nuclear transport factor 2 family protein [Sphingomonas sp. Leaf357]|uniref:nuclear transport factor 2 family protein n=1 Tax=Sphingomonas sp. Leaf357 TaxID=1736350 RepID=UPI000AA90159|nr:nuclear transport factor 2 family protein [Sphingomonas sp. Leaf357]